MWARRKRRLALDFAFAGVGFDQAAKRGGESRSEPGAVRGAHALEIVGDCFYRGDGTQRPVAALGSHARLLQPVDVCVEAVLHRAAHGV